VVGFPRAARLRSGQDFQRGLRARRRWSGRWFTASTVANQGHCARLGIVIGRRVLPQATRRNRLKRIAREHFRRLALGLGAVDVVVRLRSKVSEDDMAAAEAEVEQLFRGLA
jgi:ribonuclease P protein component